MLDKIVESAGSRITILADTIICNHDLHHSAMRLHWSGLDRRKLVVSTFEAEADTHLTWKEALTDTNAKEIERIKIGSNKICIRKDLAKEKVVFSKESSHAIFEMGNVELIEPKKSSNQCPSYFHYVFEGTFEARPAKSTIACISDFHKR